MKRQPLISSYSKVFNFCFNLLDTLSLVFKYFSSAKYSKLALIFLFSYILTVLMYSSHYHGWMSSGSSPTKMNRKKFYLLYSSTLKFLLKVQNKKCKKKKKIASSALKFVRRSKTIMHIDFFKG